MLLVVFYPDANGVSGSSASSLCLTWNIHLAFAGIMIHTKCVTMFGIFLLTWSALWLSVLILTTPVMGFITHFWWVVIFNPTKVCYSFLFKFYCHSLEPVTSHFPNIMCYSSNVIFLQDKWVHRCVVVAIKNTFCSILNTSLRCFMKEWLSANLIDVQYFARNFQV